jgi:hypothetical protein
MALAPDLKNAIMDELLLRDGRKAYITSPATINHIFENTSEYSTLRHFVVENHR